jgi:hypothetical protein
MERFIHTENLKLYRQKLADPRINDADRSTIKALLAEEEAREARYPPIPVEGSQDFARWTGRRSCNISS